ncbi:MAG: hypothetical protein IPL08_13955 [Saprospiraceae bacterium]|nr:hypothetical protein [Saprospiraceae bacterium]
MGYAEELKGAGDRMCECTESFLDIGNTGVGVELSSSRFGNNILSIH